MNRLDIAHRSAEQTWESLRKFDRLTLVVCAERLLREAYSDRAVTTDADEAIDWAAYAARIALAELSKELKEKGEL